MNYNTSNFQKLFEELETYEEKGVRIKLSGCYSSPMEVASLIAESLDYMRDYILDSSGKLLELDFQNIAGSLQ